MVPPLGLIRMEDPVIRFDARSLDLGQLHAIADGVIAASLLVVAAALLLLYYRRGKGDRRERIVLALFTLFLATAGLANFASAFALWVAPGLEGA
ncbi:MAG: hypothetical protein WBB50_06250, partial [Methyloceanibacter sp.]